MNPGTTFRNKPIGITIKLYLTAVLIFFIFRSILFFTQLDRIDVDETDFSTVLKAFMMGLRFDIVISSYLLLLPVFILFVTDIFRIAHHGVFKAIHYITFFLFALAFLICTADIPYFIQFFSRFSIGAFEWMDSPGFVIKMILQEPTYFIILIPAILLLIVYYKLLKRIISNTQLTGLNPYIKIVLYLLFLGIMFIGIRGRIAQKSPIRVGTAYFSDHAFLNKLGLNPVFTLMRSYLDHIDTRNKPVHLINTEQAINNAQEYLNIKKQEYPSPIARKIIPDEQITNKRNIVLIIMESMSAAKMQRHGNSDNLTPFLDSLSKQSIYFDQMYTAGKHTHNGIFSTLFSFPGIYRQHHLKQMNKYNGMADVFNDNGYQTIYFTTHDGQFDNVEGFLINNGFEQVISQKDYPRKEVKTTLGVPDDYMFRFSLPVLQNLAQNEDPFLAVFMTSSDHGPYYIPDYFTPRSQEIKKQIVEYADWSLSQFIKAVKKEPWYNNTIFAFVADHGAALKADYEISLDYYHSPFLIYAPEILDSTFTSDKLASQLDVFPTLAGLSGIPYVNNTFGIDLLHESRDFVTLNDDNKLGVLDEKYLLIMKKHDYKKLYQYQNSNTQNLADSLPHKVHEMETYAKSILQVHQNMIINGDIYLQQSR